LAISAAYEYLVGLKHRGSPHPPLTHLYQLRAPIIDAYFPPPYLYHCYPTPIPHHIHRCSLSIRELRIQASSALTHRPPPPHHHHHLNVAALYQRRRSFHNITAFHNGSNKPRKLAREVRARVLDGRRLNSRCRSKLVRKYGAGKVNGVLCYCAAPRRLIPGGNQRMN
jgi:hypothetical protein